MICTKKQKMSEKLIVISEKRRNLQKTLNNNLILNLLSCYIVYTDIVFI